MKRNSWFENKGYIFQSALVASAILGLAAITGLFVLPISTELPTSIKIDPAQKILQEGEDISINIIVSSIDAVNVFAGKIEFDRNLLSVKSIEYNTSIADLWTEEPWYAQGENIVSFAGGTTRAGGFTGSGTLLTINFTSQGIGEVAVRLRDTQILRHDGLGSNVPLAIPVDSIFTINDQEEVRPTTSAVASTASDTRVIIIPPNKTTDLNGDGRQSLADVSIFMLYLARGDLRADFNNDGKVNTADLSILLQAE